jgi:hypothetical protein
MNSARMANWINKPCRVSTMSSEEGVPSISSTGPVPLNSNQMMGPVSVTSTHIRAPKEAERARCARAKNFPSSSPPRALIAVETHPQIITSAPTVSGTTGAMRVACICCIVRQPPSCFANAASGCAPRRATYRSPAVTPCSRDAIRPAAAARRHRQPAPPAPPRRRRRAAAAAAAPIRRAVYCIATARLLLRRSDPRGGVTAVHASGRARAAASHRQQPGIGSQAAAASHAHRQRKTA